MITRVTFMEKVGKYRIKRFHRETKMVYLFEVSKGNIWLEILKTVHKFFLLLNSCCIKNEFNRV